MIINDHMIKKKVLQRNIEYISIYHQNVPPQKVSDMADITVSLCKCHKFRATEHLAKKIIISDHISLHFSLTVCLEHALVFSAILLWTISTMNGKPA